MYLPLRTAKVARDIEGHISSETMSIAASKSVEQMVPGPVLRGLSVSPQV